MRLQERITDPTISVSQWTPLMSLNTTMATMQTKQMIWKMMAQKWSLFAA